MLAVRSINLGQSVEGKHHSAACILVYVCALIVAFVRLAAICALSDNCISALWCVSTRVNCDLEKGTTGNNNPLVIVWDGYKGPRGMLASTLCTFCTITTHQAKPTAAYMGWDVHKGRRCLLGSACPAFHRLCCKHLTWVCSLRKWNKWTILDFASMTPQNSPHAYCFTHWKAWNVYLYFLILQLKI